jgi:hypothetical protein
MFSLSTKTDSVSEISVSLFFKIIFNTRRGGGRSLRSKWFQILIAYVLPSAHLRRNKIEYI